MIKLSGLKEPINELLSILSDDFCDEIIGCPGIPCSECVASHLQIEVVYIPNDGEDEEHF